MKKFVVSLVSVLTLLAPTQVLAEDWVRANRDWVRVGRGTLVDAGSVTVNRLNPNIRRFWAIYDDTLTGGHSLKHHEVHCRTFPSEIKTLENFQYTMFGSLLNRQSFKNSPGIIVFPGSSGMRVHDFVCK